MLQFILILILLSNMVLQELLLEAVNFLVPDKYSNFTVDFEKVLKVKDTDKIP